ncbi:LysR substrate-binding domain-containing protein [uncultured Sneathiella sp.]|uniref:LysR substrate-binding domain-containing protein n=1 Tax=uncultured Sneathiella sp. TaxID=879315 RepID=UPI0025919A87|nr:LysR substrate-binding domain-containing protein [uncultured Sneathiella sp.]
MLSVIEMNSLPSLTALRFFEAAARRLSFADAAEELNVTPAAVSRQIRQLEAQLGVQLFRRLTRAVALTPEGSAALPLITEGFARLREGVDRIRMTNSGGTLSVSVAPSLAHRWLAPRLGRFMTQFPDIELVIDASERVSNFGVDGVEIGLRFGSRPDERLRAIPLFEDPIFPVCAPRLAEQLGPSPRAHDIVKLPLLHVDWEGQTETLPRWTDWLTAAGISPIPKGGAKFSQLAVAIEAAIAGHGVALASMPLVGDDLAAGRLVRPLNVAEVAAGALHFWIVYPPENAANTRLIAFRNWVQEEARITGETDTND